jgi:rhodanese-related sulfurtransferase
MKGLKLIALLGVLAMSTERAEAAAQAETWDELMEVMYAYTVPLLEPEEAEEFIQNQQPVILDVRTDEEQSVSRIQGSRFFDYESFIMEQVQDIPKDQPILVYCALGYRSEKIGEKLLAAGYTQVYNLKGGIIHWKNRDFLITNPGGEATNRVHGVDPTWGRWLENGEVVYD